MDKHGSLWARTVSGLINLETGVTVSVEPIFDDAVKTIFDEAGEDGSFQVVVYNNTTSATTFEGSEADCWKWVETLAGQLNMMRFNSVTGLTVTGLQ